MTQTMTLERAEKIHKAMFAIALADVGITKPQQSREAAATLEDVSLSDMIAAMRVVDEDAKAKSDQSGGTRIFAVTIDDRLIAAIYTLLHYKDDSRIEPDEDVIVARLPGSRRNSLHFILVGARDVPAMHDAEEEAVA